jgi:hypothetical protein
LKTLRFLKRLISCSAQITRYNLAMNGKLSSPPILNLKKVTKSVGSWLGNFVSEVISYSGMPASSLPLIDTPDIPEMENVVPLLAVPLPPFQKPIWAFVLG